MTHFLNDISWRTPGRNDSEKIFTTDDVKTINKISGSVKTDTADTKTYALEKLLIFVENGKIVPASDIPCNVVTIGSKILMRQKHKNTTLELTIVATQKDNKSVSILSPLGLATLGLGVADNIEFYSQKGIQFLTIEKILYQPQAFGAVA